MEKKSKKIIDPVNDEKEEYKPITYESIKGLLEQISPEEDSNKKCIIFTGEGGAFDFDTEMIIHSQFNDVDQLKNLYRNLRKEYYNLNKKYIKAITPWYKKLYNYVRYRMFR